jgi:hypothetical protein
MRHLPVFALPVFALALSLGACSSPTDDANEAASAANMAQSAAADRSLANPAIDNGAQVASPDASAAPVSAAVIGLEGLGDLRIGRPIPQGSSWAERGAQISDECRTVSSPDYPGVYAIVSEGKVRRITIGQRSNVKLAEGLGIGASEAEVRKHFAGFRAEPHKYVGDQGKYLTARNAASGDPALRFEIGEEGKVSLIHVGTMPVLGYVEGCA